MAHRSLIVACFIVLIIGSLADKEYEEYGSSGHDHDHDHDHHHHHHHHDHDHDSHKKLFMGDTDGDELEQREKLRSIAKKIDTNHDGKISHDEMRAYVEERVKEQQNREADDLIATLDPKHTNKITFDAYVRDSFGDVESSQLESPDKANLHTRETRRLFAVDKQKWTHLDKDGDKSLTYDEFRSFIRPEDNVELQKIEIDNMIHEYDENHDGKISRDEYAKMTEAETGQADTLTSELDTNNDGFCDFSELARYYLPSAESNVKQETEHLLKECDKDKNGFCTIDEVVGAYSSFAGSQITDFGADLEAPKEDL